jgi:hypothetical protein
MQSPPVNAAPARGLRPELLRREVRAATGRSPSHVSTIPRPPGGYERLLGFRRVGAAGHRRQSTITRAVRCPLRRHYAPYRATSTDAITLSSAGGQRDARRPLAWRVTGIPRRTGGSGSLISSHGPSRKRTNPGRARQPLSARNRRYPTARWSRAAAMLGRPSAADTVQVTNLVGPMNALSEVITCACGGVRMNCRSAVSSFQTDRVQ